MTFMTSTLFNTLGLILPDSTPEGQFRQAALPPKEALNKSTSEMKHKAHGAQEPEHMGYM
jgi:hypothetical protein